MKIEPFTPEAHIEGLLDLPPYFLKLTGRFCYVEKEQKGLV